MLVKQSSNLCTANFLERFLGVPMNDDVYYRIQFDGTELAICCLQWFDEDRYNKNYWITNETFTSEDEALKFLRDKYDLHKEKLPIPLINALLKFSPLWKNILDTL